MRPVIVRTVLNALLRSRPESVDTRVVNAGRVIVDYVSLKPVEVVVIVTTVPVLCGMVLARPRTMRDRSVVFHGSPAMVPFSPAYRVRPVGATRVAQWPTTPGWHNLP